MNETEGRRGGFVYVGCPYSHTDALVKATRAMLVTRYVALCLADERDPVVFSPVVHGHAVHKAHAEMPITWEFWQKVDFTMLRFAQTLDILMLDGWRDSPGLQDETTMAMKLGLCIMHTPPPQIIFEDMHWRDRVEDYLIHELGRE